MVQAKSHSLCAFHQVSITIKKQYPHFNLQIEQRKLCYKLKLKKYTQSEIWRKMMILKNCMKKRKRNDFDLNSSCRKSNYKMSLRFWSEKIFSSKKKSVNKVHNILQSKSLEIKIHLFQLWDNSKLLIFLMLLTVESNNLLMWKRIVLTQAVLKRKWWDFWKIQFWKVLKSMCLQSFLMNHQKTSKSRKREK